MPLDAPKERRRFGRRPVFKVATVELATGERLDAKVVDLSDGGVRVKLADLSLLQGDFVVEIPEDDLIVKCRVIHRHESWVGAQFVRSPRRLSWVKRGGKR